MKPAALPVTRPAKGAELELSVEGLAFGGAGIARVGGDASRSGYVVFVAGAIPGDRVRARVVRSRPGWAQARLLVLLEPGPERLEPVARHPGAPWQVLPYERQLAVKQEQVVDALTRIGRLADFDSEPIVPAEQRWRYRNKLEYSFGRGDGGELVCGFHAPGRWDRIEPLEDCLLASEASNRAREQVLEHCRRAGLEPHDRRHGEGFLRNLVVREGRRTGQLQVRLVTSPGALDRSALAAAVACRGLLWTQTDQAAETTQAGRSELVRGTAALEEELCGLRLEVSPEAFLQTNTEMAERLYALVAGYAGLSGHERVFDLYCGIGTIGLALAERAGQVVGLEVVPEAVADAINNAHVNGIENARFYAGDVRLALRELVATSGRPDVVVVDPPRAGLSQKVVRRLIEAGPRRIVYVSCNPTTLAPNADQLAQAGYRLTRVRAVDMFPQTPHIECVALLELGPGGADRAG